MSFWERLIALTLTYPIALILTMMFHLGELMGWLKIDHKDRLPRRRGGILVIANHPSLLEPILVACLLYKRYWRHPGDLPLSTPDSVNYYHKWRWLPLKPVFIPIYRDKPYDTSSYRKIKSSLKEGRCVVIFPEGGRTFKGKEFRSSVKGKRIRVFKKGPATIALSVGVPILPVWVEDTEKVLPPGRILPRFWRKCQLKIGELIETSKIEMSSEDFNAFLSVALLNLADE